ncbi:LD-carboxypeptidase [uncultured Polaribacter sp.]|uniref:S66 peptidase family protein n=1 Tax=uncultured Polaribacter sp. TaxID=174711 RepID=UPI00260A4A9C|nr:LD-carboxypeptidase [uncultured Polaribacter sp.]
MKNKITFISLFLMIFSSITAQEKVMELMQPAYLKKGDSVAIVAPAGILKNKQEVVDTAKKLLESWGVEVVLGENMFNDENHFAGSDAERCEDFQKALDNKNIKAIWAARGGYGSVRILDKLDFTNFKINPKWIIGYSDITAFHNHVHNLGVESIHGMMTTSLGSEAEEIAETIASFKKALFGKELKYTIRASNYNRNLSTDIVEGQLVGGNLAILTSMLGSVSQINTNKKILFIEEIGEYKYSIDRMLQSLKRAGYFKNVKAVIVGDISNIKNNTTKWGSSIEQLILEAVPEKIPVLFNFPAGHENDNRALIFGRKVQLAVGSEQYSVRFTD